MKKNHWFDWLWIWTILYFTLGFFNILFAWLGMIDVLVPLFIAVIGGLNLYIAVYNLILFAMMRIGFNLLGLLNLAIGIVAMIGVYRLHRKQEHLKAEQNLFE